jgi:hypothetical protein
MARVRDEDLVFDAVARLVSAGEYLDTIPGRPGVDLDGGGMFRPGPAGVMRRIYRRGSRRYEQARARGWIEPLPPLQPASLDAVVEAESLAGRPLPSLLRRLYLHVGNGGFGPAYGLLGLRGGHTAGEVTAITRFERGAGRDAVGPAIPLVLCDWGCGITSLIDLSDGQVWGSDPNPAPNDVDCCFLQGMTVADWFGQWLDGTLNQPWLVQDPSTGHWRGATEVEYAAEIADFDNEHD